MRELLDRADSSDKPYDEAIRSLQAENSCLRRNLIEVQTKLARLIATMQTLSGTVAKALDDSDLGEAAHDPNDLLDDCVAPGFRTADLVPRAPDDLDFLNTGIIIEPFGNTVPRTEATRFAVNPSPRCEKSPGADLAASFSSLAQQIPSIWSFEYQMGLDPYISAIASSEESSLALGKSWTESNSPFSDHIHVLQRLMKSKIEYKMKLPGQTSRL